MKQQVLPENTQPGDILQYRLLAGFFYRYRVTKVEGEIIKADVIWPRAAARPNNIRTFTRWDCEELSLVKVSFKYYPMGGAL